MNLLLLLLLRLLQWYIYIHVAEYNVASRTQGKTYKTRAHTCVYLYGSFSLFLSLLRQQQICRPQEKRATHKVCLCYVYLRRERGLFYGKNRPFFFSLTKQNLATSLGLRKTITTIFYIDFVFFNS